MAPIIVWFRNDLRLDDNPAFYAAAQTGCPIIPLFILPHGLGGATHWWLHHSLSALNHDLNGHLVFRQGASINILETLKQETGAQAIYANGVESPGITSFSPNRLFPSLAKRFQVFTPFWKHCLGHETIAHPLPKPTDVHYQKVVGETWDLLPKIDWAQGLHETWRPGESGASKRFQDFINHSLECYSAQRDRPDLSGTSMMSPHLRWGEISVRRMWQCLQTCEPSPSLETYQRELGWREFSYHLLKHFPHLATQPLKDIFSFDWSQDKDLLKCWQRGQTGYPIVDAGMRQLWRTGWMHNRVRMIVGSFLVKDLLIDWREGEKWFWDTLVDADPASNAASWQWIAGCGADAAPYFRVFNPVLQGEKFDPDGAYVRQWVPELSQLSAKHIHKPWIMGGVEGYPAPVVNHDLARKRFLMLMQKKTSSSGSHMEFNR